MKKIIYLGVSLAVTSASVQAQGIRYGVRAGVNVSTVTGQGRYNGGLSLGHNIGFVASIPLTPEHFFFQPELVYIRKGFRLTTPSVTFQPQVRLHYLNVPLLAKIKAGRLVLEAGPQVGYLVSGSEGNPTLSLREQRSLNPYQRWELGYLAGIGYELRNGLGVGMRYNAGLTYVRQVPNRLRNSTIQLQLSYLVPRR